VGFSDRHPLLGGPGSVVGIATGYGLGGPGIESRWGARFSAPVQTGPGAHPASCTMGARYFSRVKSGRGVTLTPHPLRAVRPVQSLSACTKSALYFFLPYPLPRSLSLSVCLSVCLSVPISCSEQLACYHEIYSDPQSQQRLPNAYLLTLIQ